MIRKSTIDSLLQDKVISRIESNLATSGFKFQKSKKHFSKKEGEYDYIITIGTAYNPIQFDEGSEKIYLDFFIRAALECPAFNEWYLKKSGEPQLGPIHSVTSKKLRVELQFDDFNKESFYTPTASQQFKMNVARSLAGPSGESYTLFDDYLMEGLQKLVADLLDLNTVEKIFASREYPLSLTGLLVYAGLTDLANQQFDLTNEYYIRKINEKLETKPEDARSFMSNYEDFISLAAKVGNRTYTSPFIQSIKLLDNQHHRLELTSKSTFAESLRFDLSKVQVKSHQVNASGEVAILVAPQRVIKFSPSGKTLLNVTIPTPEGFDGFMNLTMEYLEGTDEFVVNNYIITKDNRVVELPLPPKAMKRGARLPSPHVSDLAYSGKNDKYMMLFDNSLLSYSRDGKLEKNDFCIASKVYPEKEWLIMGNATTYTIKDFSGQLVGEFEFGQGNRDIAFSCDYRYMVLHGYSTKSQFYYLSNNKKGVLWAHPTYVRNYRELMYNDIENNFGLEIVAFAADSTFVVGAAYHGKYVAWTLPKLERTELIPLPETFPLLAKTTTLYSSDNTETKKILMPEVVELEGQSFFKNRGNVPRSIFFIDDGDAFCMSIYSSSLLLVWDRTFKNTGFVKTEGVVRIHGTRIISRLVVNDKQENQLIIYKKLD